MKNCFLFVILLSSFFCLSQINEETTYVVDYIGAYRMYSNLEGQSQEYFRLIKRADSSIFQSYNSMKRDTIVKEIITTGNFKKLPFTKHFYSIKYKNDSLVFLDKMYSKQYSYGEKTNFKWQYHNEFKVISGNNCRLASTMYAGRKWYAWYAIDIPIDSGPYKFKGLPGLIMECFDEEENYKWNFYKMYKSDRKVLFQKYHIDSPFDEIILTNRQDFLLTQFELENASFSDLENKSSKGFGYELTGDQDNTRLRKINNNKNIFIPIEIKE